MIFDRMERLTQYKGLNANLDAVIDFVLTHPAETLASGINEIDGKNAFINNMVSQLKPASDLFERHTEYIDLQIPLDEGEIITVRPVEDLDWGTFETETALTPGPAGLPLDLMPGTFAIFFPGDAHNCTLSKSGQTTARKLVGKAKV